MTAASDAGSMGNCCVVEGAVDHWIYVKVGDRKQPLTDARLRVIVQDITGKHSPTIKLDCLSKNEFERGSQEVFEVGCCALLESICITHDSFTECSTVCG